MVEEFMKYISNYTGDKEYVIKKAEHSLRVYEDSIKYAFELGFNDKDIKTASLIGLLHDIGRFEERKKGKPKNFDHAKYAVKLLFEEGLIENFSSDKDTYDEISFAILNHNGLNIKGESEEGLKFAKLIRDLDKMDKIRQFGSLGVRSERVDESAISKEIKEHFDTHTPIPYSIVQTKNDKIAMRLALAFGLNYSIILKEYKSLLEIYHDRVGYHEEIEELYQKVMNYLDERIDKEC